MELTSKEIYNTIITGAYRVIKNKEVLNKINVFPVRDGDTGNNLSSMMLVIIQKAELKSTVRKTLESVAEAALHGARGNSGIIFAQYLHGLSQSVSNAAAIDIHDYAKANKEAVMFAYNAIEEPVEGTMLTLMRAWGDALNQELQKLHKPKTLTEIFSNAYSQVESALERTKKQLQVLRKANVVDSGAKGFTYFIEGALYYIKNGEHIKVEAIANEEKIFSSIQLTESDIDGNDFRYCTECLLEGQDIDIPAIKKFLQTRGVSTVVAGTKNKCRIHIHTNEPATIFEYLYEKGTIVYQKIDDIFRQQDVLVNQKSKIAVVTDSIADLPQEVIDAYQIHVVNLEILHKDYIYIDKLTIRPPKLLKIAQASEQLPTSSQSSPKKIENLYEYLSSCYDAVIVLTVSKTLSGNYNNFKKVAEKYNDKNLKIRVLDTKQNSGAQGLLVQSCAELVDTGLDVDTVVEEVRSLIQKSKILVQVRNLDHMIKSGRLGVKAGKIGRRIGMKPIITLDKKGKGALDSIAFSVKGSNKKILKHLNKVLKKNKISKYCFVHVNDLAATKSLVDSVQKIIGFPPAYIEETSSVVALAAGQSAVAVAYVLAEKG